MEKKVEKGVRRGVQRKVNTEETNMKKEERMERGATERRGEM